MQFTELILAAILLIWLTATILVQTSSTIRRRLRRIRFFLPLPFWRLFSPNIPRLSLCYRPVRDGDNSDWIPIHPVAKGTLLSLFTFRQYHVTSAVVNSMAGLAQVAFREGHCDLEETLHYTILKRFVRQRASNQHQTIQFRLSQSFYDSSRPIQRLVSEAFDR